MGQESAELLQIISSASGRPSGIFASVLGVITLLVMASGVFGEMQLTLNATWKAEPKGGTVSRLLRARAASLGLVAALGFLLLVSLGRYPLGQNRVGFPRELCRDSSFGLGGGQDE